MRKASALILILFLVLFISSNTTAITGWMLSDDNQAEEQIISLVRYSTNHFLNHGRQISLSDISQDILPEESPLRKIASGVFITYILDGKSRGCYGSITPRYQSLAEELIQVSVEALNTGMPKPLTADEFQRAQISVVIVDHLEPIKNPLSINPFTQGLFVQSGDREAILLPGEARTARYAVQWILQKAGIKDVNVAHFYTFKAWHFGAKLQLISQ
jgi:AMMECR1 domain-containing protein